MQRLLREEPTMTKLLLAIALVFAVAAAAASVLPQPAVAACLGNNC
jgi:hypothetical protein